MSEKVMVGRFRSTDFIVNYTGNDGKGQRYVWVGSKGDRVDKKLIPQDIVDDLTMSGTTFTDGELVVLNEKDEKIDVEGVDNPEQYNDNTNSKKEIKKILNSPLASMKKDLKKISVIEEKQFVIEVAKEIKLDSKVKLKYLADWLGVKEELLFD